MVEPSSTIPARNLVFLQPPSERYIVLQAREPPADSSLLGIPYAMISVQFRGIDYRTSA